MKKRDARIPKKCFVFFRTLSPLKKPLILDLGCGTGISTRQLAPFGIVIGCDPDPLMLRAAKKHPKIAKETYVVGSAARLPFKDAIFDIVTAFAAFHWFDDAKSIQEIKRILKPGGLFFAVNKNGVKTWSEGYRRAIIKTIGKEIATFQKDRFQPTKALRTHGFQKVRVMSWKKSEIYSVGEAITYAQSVSIWNTVPTRLRTKAINGLTSYFKNVDRVKGKIERKLEVKVVTARKL